MVEKKNVSTTPTPPSALAEYATPKPLLEIEGFLHLTTSYAKQGEVEKATEMAEWAVRLACRLKSDAGLAMATQAVAEVFLATGNLKRAKEAFSKSVDLWGKAGWPHYLPNTQGPHFPTTTVSSHGGSKVEFGTPTRTFSDSGLGRTRERFGRPKV